MQTVRWEGSGQIILFHEEIQWAASEGNRTNQTCAVSNKNLKHQAKRVQPRATIGGYVGLPARFRQRIAKELALRRLSAMLNNNHSGEASFTAALETTHRNFPVTCACDSHFQELPEACFHARRAHRSSTLRVWLFSFGPLSCED